MLNFKFMLVLVDSVQEALYSDPKLIKIKSEVEHGQRIDFIMRRAKALGMGTRLCIPSVNEPNREILNKLVALFS